MVNFMLCKFYLKGKEGGKQETYQAQPVCFLVWSPDHKLPKFQVFVQVPRPP